MANTNNSKKSLNRVALMKENNSNLEFLYIDGIKVGAMGSVSDADREAGIKVIQRIVDNSNKKGMALVMEVMSQVNFEASMNENHISDTRKVCSNTRNTRGLRNSGGGWCRRYCFPAITGGWMPGGRLNRNG